MSKKPSKEVDTEIGAIGEVYAALKDLERDAQSRVLQYVAGKLGLSSIPTQQLEETRGGGDTTSYNESTPRDLEQRSETTEGISPVANRWMTRNGFSPGKLATLFSLGADEIDLVAKKVPGKGKKARMRSVFLLRGIAAYLSTGAPRFSHEQIKEACLHYDAYDATNFSRYLKSFSSEIGGSKDSGYSLIARGMSSAQELVKELVEVE